MFLKKNNKNKEINDLNDIIKNKDILINYLLNELTRKQNQLKNVEYLTNKEVDVKLLNNSKWNCFYNQNNIKDMEDFANVALTEYNKELKKIINN